jgi:hypothetical protein
MKRSKNRLLALETLEDRLTPAFTFQYTPSIDLWTLTQTQNDGDVVVTVDGANDLSVSEGGGPAVTVGVANGSLRLTMLSNTDDVSVTLDGGLGGNLTINLQSGARDLQLDGAANFVGSNLSITAGTGDQTVDLSDNAPLTVGGSVSIDLGLGDDTVTTSGEDVLIGSNFTMRGVNTWSSTDTVVVGGNLAMYANTENIDSVFDLFGTGSTVVGGSFTYLGGNARDRVFLNNDVIIGGNVNINLGNDVSGLFPQVVNLDDALIGGSVTITGGTISGSELIDSNAGTTIGGNIYINTGTLGSPGDTVTLLGSIGGNSVTVLTGMGADSVTYAMTGSNPRVYASLGFGSDTFTLGTGAGNPDLGYLYIDFGASVDSFDNNYIGAFPFPVFLRNLP